MEPLANQVDHGGGDLLMSGCIRVIAVAGQVRSLVRVVIRALEYRAKVDVVGVGVDGRSLDHGVHLVGHACHRADVDRSLGVCVPTAEPHTPVIQQDQLDRASRRELVYPSDDLVEVGAPKQRDPIGRQINERLLGIEPALTRLIREG